MLANCSDSASDWPEPSPALWEVTAPNGQTGWLFGTIHSLPDGVNWRTPLVDRTIDEAGVVMLEIADLKDFDGTAMFRELGESDGLPPLLERFEEAERAQVRKVLDRTGSEEEDFARSETWATALTLSNRLSKSDPANGVDRALEDMGKPMIGMESFPGQLSIFDRLPEAEQEDLLLLIAREAEGEYGDTGVIAWLTGDLELIEARAEESIFGDPELREALHAARNRAWLPEIEQTMADGRKPLVAVGAAHMLGADGLPALLEAQGYTLRRIQ